MAANKNAERTCAEYAYTAPPPRPASARMQRAKLSSPLPPAVQLPLHEMPRDAASPQQHCRIIHRPGRSIRRALAHSSSLFSST
jgi:hypothetical protein